MFTEALFLREKAPGAAAPGAGYSFFRAKLLFLRVFQLDLAAGPDLLAHRLDIAGVNEGLLGDDRAEQLVDQDRKQRDVADQVGLSSSHFSTTFKQETGKSFVEFLTSVRMDKAKEMLCFTDMKASQISYEVGYKDPHYFSYLFKKTQGCTPSEYRSRRM